MSESLLHVKTTQKVSEPTESVVGFRPHQSLIKLDPQMPNTKVNYGSPQNPESTKENNYTLNGHPLHSISYMVIKFDPYKDPA